MVSFFLDGPSLMLVDPMSIDLMTAMETKALISMIDFADTNNDQDTTDKLLVRIEVTARLRFLLI